MTILGSGSVQITISPRTAPVIVGIIQTRRIKFIASIQKNNYYFLKEVAEKFGELKNLLYLCSKKRNKQLKQ
jgi:hypothetical protein